MARLQILELPEGASDDRPPFVLVVDEAETGPDGKLVMTSSDFEGTCQRIGARAVLVFEETIDIPANDTSAYASGPATGQEIVVELAGQDPQGAIDAAIQKVKDGPRLAHERTDIARDMDRLAKWEQELTDALGMDRLRDWDDIRNAARGIRKQRDAQAETLERVRNLPEQPECMDAQHPDPTAYLHGYGVAIRDAKRATYPPQPTKAADKAVEWCCSDAFQTLGHQHNDDCTEAATR